MSNRTRDVAARNSGRARAACELCGRRECASFGACPQSTQEGRKSHAQENVKRMLRGSNQREFLQDGGDGFVWKRVARASEQAGSVYSAKKVGTLGPSAIRLVKSSQSKVGKIISKHSTRLQVAAASARHNTNQAC